MPSNVRPIGLAALAASAAAAPTGRVYGHANIKRMLQKHGRSRQIGYSIAHGPHENKREIARRQRQAARNAVRQRDRYFALNGEQPPPDQLGYSRRGNRVFA